MTQEEKWQRCLFIIKANVSEQEYQTWFSPVKLDSYSPQSKEVTLFVPSHFIYEFLEGKYKRVLLAVLWKVFGKNTTLKYRIDADHINHITTELTSATTTEVPKIVTEGRGTNARKVIQAPPQPQPADDLDPQLNPDYTFDNFIEGASNRLPRSVGQSIADNPSQVTFNPFFIYGHSGVGKTHLLNAIGLRLKQKHPEKRVLYLSAHLFEVQFTESRRTNNFNDFIHFYQTIDVLLLDDVQELEGKTGTLNAFFHIFNHLKQNGKQIILSCDRNPQSLQGMEERLITRFKWGLTAELAQPNEELCRRILMSKIGRDGLNIPEDVIDYIAKNVNESVRDLEGVVNSLMAQSVVYNRDIDLAMAEKVVKRTLKAETKPVTMDEIVQHCCEAFKVDEANIVSASRKANIVEARNVIMLLASELLHMTTAKIGMRLGGRNHATVLHGVKQINERMEMDATLAQKVKKLKDDIKQHKPLK